MTGTEASDECRFLSHHLSWFVRRSRVTHHRVRRQAGVRTIVAGGGQSDYSIIKPSAERRIGEGIHGWPPRCTHAMGLTN
jgi:hypothetical protein